MDTVDKYSENELLIKVAAGDEDAFSKLFNQWHQEVGAYIYLITKNHTATDEIVQELFIKLWNKRVDLIHISSFRAYLFTAARNHTYNTLRNMARKQELEKNYLIYKGHVTEDSAPHPSHIDFSDLIDRAVAQLSPQRQKVYILSRINGLSQKEIAAQLGISTETVKKHIMASVKEIKTYLVKTSGLSTSLIIVFFSKF